ncbi:hypothetical protein VTL71DRAFT_2967 [Oculimacula yallundae]|uniref:Uncharacterized protein n=1 Tax=Oculimacula yallundae TaxID=86028 RepID=A0ABR4C5T4_9HELO
MSTLTSFCLFGELPDDMKLLILSKMLIAEPTAIVNPWMQHNLDNDPQVHKKYPWSRGFNTNILATSKQLYGLGMKLLYEQNTFVFTRLIVHNGVETETLTRRLRVFLEEKHTFYPPDEPSYEVARALLIRRVAVQESDVDCHLLARRGYAHPIPILPDVQHVEFMTTVLRRMKNSGCKLLHLTVTLDEIVPGIVSSLQRLANEAGGGNIIVNPNYSAPGTGRPYARILRTPAWLGLHGTVATTDDPPVVFSLQGLGVELLTVHGSIEPSENARKMVPAGVGALGAIVFQDWLWAYDIRPIALRYTGPFPRRVLDKDGNIPMKKVGQLDDSRDLVFENGWKFWVGVPLLCAILGSGGSVMFDLDPLEDRLVTTLRVFLYAIERANKH